MFDHQFAATGEQCFALHAPMLNELHAVILFVGVALVSCDRHALFHFKTPLLGSGNDPVMATGFVASAALRLPLNMRRSWLCVITNHHNSLLAFSVFETSLRPEDD